MRKVVLFLLTVGMILSFSACGEKTTKAEEDGSFAEDNQTNITVKASPDKYTWYIKNYVGKNVASFGYTSAMEDRRDEYGAANIKLVFVAEDGSYIDPSDIESLKKYVVTGQNIAPNTELKLTFDKDSSGIEYDNLVENQSIEEISLSVKEAGEIKEKVVSLTSIKVSPDKYTWYIKDYVGKNVASFGYTSLMDDRRDEYGAANVKLVLIADDGTYIDPTDVELMKNYVVTGQNIEPNTELKLIFDKDSEGVEYDNLVENQNIEEIELQVKRISTS